MKAYLKRHGKFFFFLFLFSWIFTLKNKLGLASNWDDFVFHPDAPFWVFLNSLFIFFYVDFLKRKIDKKTSFEKYSNWTYLRSFGLGYLIYIVVNIVFSLLIAFIFDTFDRNFGSTHQVTYKLVNYSIDFFIFGGFVIAYLYWHELNNYKKQVAEFQLSKAKSKINQLKEQLNPHFLFNNLNILDQLIWEDKYLASDYLASFSELYRITLHTIHKDLIPISEELTFTKHYFKMMAMKYKGYELMVSPEVEQAELLIPPYCLQVLIENVFTHNMASADMSVKIYISLGKELEIRNNKLAYERKKETNGIALKNLNEQFQLWVNSPILIEDSDKYFSVKLPLIKTTAYA